MIYLDNAATSYPKPPTVRHAVKEALSAFGGNPGRGGHRLSLAAAEMVYDCRTLLCELFGASAPERVIFTSGATMALNLAILIHVRRGGHILISDREHNAVLRTVHRLASEGIAEYEIYPTRGDVAAAIRERIRPNTAMVVACHTSNVTGYTLPLSKIAALCHEESIPLIVDAAQSAGHLPIDLSVIPLSALCFPAHKGLLGAPGAGGLILGGDDTLPPFLTGGSGVDSLSPTMPAALPERYEAGTLPTLPIAALTAGVRYLRERGIEEIAESERCLRRRILEGLSVLGGIRLYEPECEGSLVAFTHDRLPPERLARALDEHGIAVRAGYHCAPLAHRTVGTPEGGCVRVSLGAASRKKDAEGFLRAMQKIIKEN